MRRNFIILLVFITMAASAFAQTETDSLQENLDQNGKVAVWIDSSIGLGLWDSYDNGTVPYPNLGIAGSLDLGVTVEWDQCRVQPEARLVGGILADPSGYAIDIDLRLAFLYRFYDSPSNHWHFWGGGGVQLFEDVKVMPGLMNAASGISSFTNVCGTAAAEYDFAPIHDGNHHLLTAYGQLTLPILGTAMRPGYAYMDNYTSDIDMTNTVLGDYETLGMFIPGVTTDIGLRFNLLNGNKIGVSYRWDYLTTGSQGIYRYDNAVHTINFTFMFNVN